MKKEDLAHWQQAVDIIEDETRDHLDMEAPELKAGESWLAPDGRLWKKVPILYGAIGGRWCYWKKVKAELGRVADSSGDFTGDGGIIVDTIFNGWSPFFAGMLRIPYDGHVTESLMLVRGDIAPRDPLYPQESEANRRRETAL